jgi:amino acid permease
MACLLSAPSPTHPVYFLGPLEQVFPCTRCLRPVALACFVLAAAILAAAGCGDGCKTSLESQTRFVSIRECVVTGLRKFQIAWLSIGLASWRFRKAWIRQGRSLDEMKFRASWTWPWGPYFVVRVLILLSTSSLTRATSQIITVTALILSAYFAYSTAAFPY